MNSNVVAELWAVKEGMQLATNLGITHLYVESDSMVTINFCNQLSDVPWHLRTLMSDIMQMVLQFSTIQFHHRYRQANCVADYLAKAVVAQTLNAQWIGSPPVCIKPLLYADMVGRAFPRFVKL
ncbi:Ribonuclease H domain [Macleaya cordata]|uniref:Ribonuclease H domain n=1 Tax=Macleaya cordata TaxID=56857 RepID=A0A200QAF3_MACCD|nr:Ribonuclease H domain [Macleaya cordata]